ncbi:MAG: molybdate ABC transporter substrate-binding protein [Rhodobacter sp.]|nr:molybdate ABC transporter substrate-binding protein [Rhodobacter sp.]
MPLLRIALLTLLLAAPARAAEVTVFAAASLKTALDQIAADWQAASGQDVVVSYGGSAALARQIIQAAPVDIYISAAPEWMDAVEAAGLLQGGTRTDLLGNRLVLVAHGPGRVPVSLDETLNLAALLEGGRLAMGLVDAVPAGQYGKAALVSLGLWDGVKDRTAQSENVRIALQLVALGEAPLGIVYASDAVAEPRVSVIATFPETSYPPIRYPAALLSDNVAAVAFFAYLSSPDTRKVFARQGFLPLGAP